TVRHESQGDGAGGRAPIRPGLHPAGRDAGQCDRVLLGLPEATGHAGARLPSRPDRLAGVQPGRALLLAAHRAHAHAARRLNTGTPLTPTWCIEVLPAVLLDAGSLVRRLPDCAARLPPIGENPLWRRIDRFDRRAARQRLD